MSHCSTAAIEVPWIFLYFISYSSTLFVFVAMHLWGAMCSCVCEKYQCSQTLWETAWWVRGMATWIWLASNLISPAVSESDQWAETPLGRQPLILSSILTPNSPQAFVKHTMSSGKSHHHLPLMSHCPVWSCGFVSESWKGRVENKHRHPPKKAKPPKDKLCTQVFCIAPWRGVLCQHRVRPEPHCYPKANLSFCSPELCWLWLH